MASDLLHGWRLLRAHPGLLALMTALAVQSFFGGIFSALYELFVFRVSHLTALDLGLLVTSGGVGALAAALVLPRLTRRVPLGVLLFGAFVVAESSNFLIPTAPRAAVGAFLFLFGAQVIGDGAGTLFSIGAVIVQQRVVDAASLGRLSGSIGLVTQTLALLGALGAGLLAVRIGVREAFWIAPVGTLLAAPALLSRRLWRAALSTTAASAS